MSCLSIKYWREVIEFLRCFFVVINENEPALMITKGAIHNQIHVYSFRRSSRDLASPDKILCGVREEKWQLTNP